MFLPRNACVFDGLDNNITELIFRPFGISHFFFFSSIPSYAVAVDYSKNMTRPHAGWHENIVVGQQLLCNRVLRAHVGGDAHTRRRPEKHCRRADVKKSIRLVFACGIVARKCRGPRSARGCIRYDFRHGDGANFRPPEHSVAQTHGGGGGGGQGGQFPTPPPRKL